MLAMEIDAAAFMMMELTEMASLLQISPPDTFQGLGFGGFSWSGVSWGVLLCIVVALLFSPRFVVNIVLNAPRYGDWYVPLATVPWSLSDTALLWYAGNLRFALRAEYSIWYGHRYGQERLYRGSLNAL